MSRTEGITLPRLPTHHARVTSSRAIQPHPAASSRTADHRRAITEPTYTAFVGTPRQDVPRDIYSDAAMFDDVFDKKGQLLLSRNTPKITAPLNSLGYSSLHDPHCRKLFLNNKKLRSHLMHLGLITDDLKVVATTTEQRQKIRAHELLERREQLVQKLESHEESRIEKLQKQCSVPARYRKSFYKVEERRERAKEIQKMKAEKQRKAQEERNLMEKKAKEKRERKLKTAIEESQLMDQARRNAARAQQELAEAMAYHKHYGKYGSKIANWRRESDRIHNQMIAMERKGWSRKEQIHLKPVLSDISGSTITRESGMATPQVLPGIDARDHAMADSTNQTPQPPESTDKDNEAISAHKELSKPDTSELTGATDGMKSSEVQANTIEQLGEIAGQIEGLKVDDTSPGATQEYDPDEQQGGPVQREDLVDGSTGLETRTSPQTLVTEASPEGVPGGTEGALGGTVELPSADADVEVRLLDPEEGNYYLTQVILEVFNRGDPQASGYVTTEDFMRVLNSRDLGLQLNEAEIQYLAETSDFYQNGYIPYIQVAPQLPEVLKILYNQRAEQSLQLFGVYPEEQWCELLPNRDDAQSSNVCYLHKLTGAMQLGGRPDDFRPFLKDDMFEDAIVDFFETADIDKDGVLSYDDYCTLLVSPMIASRIYQNQMDDLITHYLDHCIDPAGWMNLENFAPLARELLLMIYQNTYPVEEDWIELETRKFGNVFFNKTTGEARLSNPGEQPTPAEGHLPPSGDREGQGSRKRRRRHRVSWSDRDTPTDQTTPSRSAPPPLMRRRSRESREEPRPPIPGTTEDTDSTLSSVPEESED